MFKVINAPAKTFFHPCKLKGCGVHTIPDRWDFEPNSHTTYITVLVNGDSVDVSVNQNSRRKWC